MLEENPLLPQDRALPEDVRLLVNDDNAGVVVTAADIKTVLERLGPWGYGLEKTKRALPLEEVYRDGREDQVLPQDNRTSAVSVGSTTLSSAPRCTPCAGAADAEGITRHTFECGMYSVHPRPVVPNLQSARAPRALHGAMQLDVRLSGTVWVPGRIF